MMELSAHTIKSQPAIRLEPQGVLPVVAQTDHEMLPATEEPLLEPEGPPTALGPALAKAATKPIVKVGRGGRGNTSVAKVGRGGRGRGRGRTQAAAVEPELKTKSAKAEGEHGMKRKPASSQTLRLRRRIKTSEAKKAAKPAASAVTHDAKDEAKEGESNSEKTKTCRAQETWYHENQPVLSLLPAELLPSSRHHGEKSYTVSMGEFKVTVRLDVTCFYIKPVDETFKKALLSKSLNIDKAGGVTLNWRIYGMTASVNILNKLKAGDRHFDPVE